MATALAVGSLGFIGPIGAVGQEDEGGLTMVIDVAAADA